MFGGEDRHGHGRLVYGLAGVGVDEVVAGIDGCGPVVVGGFGESLPVEGIDGVGLGGDANDGVVWLARIRLRARWCSAFLTP